MLENPSLQDQRRWAREAGRVLGLAADPKHDYIATVIAWRRDAVLSMIDRIESVTGRSWVAGIAAVRHFSECMIYGRYADEIGAGADHFRAADELCRVYWKGPVPNDEGFRSFVDGLEAGQVAIGMQSFIGTDIGQIRRLIAA